jgi:hypothetical protein
LQKCALAKSRRINCIAPSRQGCQFNDNFATNWERHGMNLPMGHLFDWIAFSFQQKVHSGPKWTIWIPSNNHTHDIRMVWNQTHELKITMRIKCKTETGFTGYFSCYGLGFSPVPYFLV